METGRMPSGTMDMYLSYIDQRLGPRSGVKFEILFIYQTYFNSRDQKFWKGIVLPSHLPIHCNAGATDTSMYFGRSQQGNAILHQTPVGPNPRSQSVVRSRNTGVLLADSVLRKRPDVLFVQSVHQQCLQV